MKTPRISASSYSNTAPLIWSFLYGTGHGRVELILDNAPARSVELLDQKRVDAALVPVIAYQLLEDVRIIPDVCVGAKEEVRSVCLMTNGADLADVRSVALDVSSKTSVALTKIIFREFYGFEPAWKDAEPDPEAMLKDADCALIIGDPALSIADRGSRTADRDNPKTEIRKFDLVEIWRRFTGLGFVFAMWMRHRDGTGAAGQIDFARARDEGLEHLDEIIANYQAEIPLGPAEFRRYLTQNISYTVDESMRRGMDLFFELAHRHGLIAAPTPLKFTGR